ncbi:MULTISPECIES: hypothetical protein [Klebsiella pneumoniae complex]|uniref:hypothetical protein n=1 Tax=Klebsiella pneumoniae complex TaxID=3390273 RepID=UPI001955241F|nr:MULTISPECIES: hypothetical protein [Klebsiella]HDO7030481.1 hypothetical protein [Klebsiella pneumoniae]
MSDMLGRVVKAQRIDFIVKFMVSEHPESEAQCLLSEWLGELTEDLLNDLKVAGREPPKIGGLQS